MKSLEKNKIVKTPVIMQLEALECGAACLSMILAYFGKWIPLEKVRYDCGVSRDGSNVSNIVKAAALYDLNAKAFSVSTDVLKKDWFFPCIIHWEFVHFVVLNGFKGNKVYINDPANGNVVIDFEKFKKSFTGICIVFEPNEEFKQEGEKPNVYKIVVEKLKSVKSTFVYVALISLCLSFFTFLLPIFDRVYVDRVLTKQFSGHVGRFFILFVICMILQIVLKILQDLSNYRVNGKMASIGNLTFLWKILNLPLVFFSQRSVGDLMNRQNANSIVANTLINTIAPLFFDVVMVFFYLIVMIRYSILLTIIGVFSAILSIYIANFVTNKKINKTKVMLNDNAKLYSTIIQGISMIDTIKSNAVENEFFAKWAGLHAKYLYNRHKILELDEYFIAGLRVLVTTFDQIIFVAGIYLCISGNFSVGMILAFSGFYKSFIKPSITVVSTGQVLQETYTQVERIDDVMKYPEDNILCNDNTHDDRKKLSGDLSIKNIKFGYSRLAMPIIKDFSLELKKGHSVAIVGGSGSGKSTISKLISGLYKPWEGEIYLDGKKINEIPKEIIKNSLAVVDQDIILYEDTIKNNIKMWDESIMDFEIILACKDAHIHDDILKKPKGYDYELIENGQNLSGGERQRIEIARVLTQDPTIVILDEATSALDTKTEYEVVKDIKKRGITCIVIAHRLSTIRTCDEIIVLDKGEVIDRGTHKELIDRCEKYRGLILSE